jgi:hypothetical protein
VTFVSVKLLVVIFSEGVNNGVPGCEIFAPFSRKSVELSGVIVVFVGSTATAEVKALIASDITKMAPKIRNRLFIMVREL